MMKSVIFLLNYFVCSNLHTLKEKLWVLLILHIFFFFFCFQKILSNDKYHNSIWNSNNQPNSNITLSLWLFRTPSNRQYDLFNRLYSELYIYFFNTKMIVLLILFCNYWISKRYIRTCIIAGLDYFSSNTRWIQLLF